MTETGFIGADINRLRQMGEAINAHAATVERVQSESNYRVNRLTDLWVGPGADMFAAEWYGRHALALRNAEAVLRDAAIALEANARQQEAASATLDRSDGSSFRGNATDFLLGDIFNFYTGGDDAFPYGALGHGFLKMYAAGFSKLPWEHRLIFNQGFVGRNVASLLSRGPGVLNTAGVWLKSPAATNFFRGAGIAGGVVSTGIGLYGLYQQGNPIDAFHREGAGYVADVASTAFSASTTAFLIAPHPITGALVIGTGVVWAGAELVDHWDEVSEFAGNAWDSGTDLVSGAWDSGTDFASDAGDYLISPSRWF